MLHYQRYGFVHRPAGTALFVACVLASACQNKEPTATTQGAAVTQSAALKESAASSPVDPKNPCTVPSASAAHVAEVLGTGPLTGPKNYGGKGLQRCNYGGKESIIIEIELEASSINLDSARKMVEQYVGGATVDVPGFGDKAFSHTKSTPMGKETLVINSLGVLAGKTMIFLSSKASFEKIRALETDLLRDLGAK